MSSAGAKNGMGQAAEKSAARKSPVKIISVATGLALLGACTTPAPPPPPPPPPPVVEVVPFRPLPPGGASYVMRIPAKNALGLRETVNLGVSDEERVWHFRSAWNVAALNCTSAQYDPIVAAYSAYITDHARPLKQLNDRIEARYRQEQGSRREALKARERHMTSVYNFFALPPVRNSFCTAALDLSNRYLAGGVDPIEFAAANFGVFEWPFEQFFLDYEQYQRESAAWDARYGVEYGPSQPGWQEVQAARMANAAVPVAGQSDPGATLANQPDQTLTVQDPETGAQVPVVPTDTNFISQPVVEPVSIDEDGEDGSGGN